MTPERLAAMFKFIVLTWPQAASWDQRAAVQAWSFPLGRYSDDDVAAGFNIILHDSGRNSEWPPSLAEVIRASGIAMENRVSEERAKEQRRIGIERNKYLRSVRKGGA